MDTHLTISKIQSTKTTRDIHIEEIKLWNTVKLIFSKFPRKTITNRDQLPLLVLHDNNQSKSNGKYSTKREGLRFLKLIRGLKNVITVIVLKEDNEILQRFVNSYFENQNHVAVLSDSFSWKDLTYQWQTKLLAKQILDQSSQKSLLEFCSSFKYEEQTKFQESFLNGQLLVDLLNYKEIPILFRQTIPPVCRYVNRRLRSRFNLSNSVYKLGTNDDIFVFENFTSIDHFRDSAKTTH